MSEEKTIPIVPIVAGEVFLQDKVVDDQKCYICKRDVNKYETEDASFLRISKGKMGFCCNVHTGVVQEFVKQFDRLPYGWEKHDTNVKDLKIEKKSPEDIESIVSNKPVTNKYRKSSGARRKIKKRSN